MIEGGVQKNKSLKKLTLLTDSHGSGPASKLQDKLKRFEVSAVVYPGATLKIFATKVSKFSESLTVDDIILIIGDKRSIK